MSLFLLFRPAGFWTTIITDTHDGTPRKRRRSLEDAVKDTVRRALYEKGLVPDVVQAIRKKDSNENHARLILEFHDTITAGRYLENLKGAEEARKEAIQAITEKLAAVELEIMKIQAADDEFMMMCLLH